MARNMKPVNLAEFETVRNDFVRLRIMHDVGDGLVVGDGCGGLRHVCVRRKRRRQSALEQVVGGTSTTNTSKSIVQVCMRVSKESREAESWEGPTF
jgi:hypothetical protein